MSNFYLNSREIKSFKLLNQLKTSQKFFDLKDGQGIFISFDALDQNEQLSLREELAKNNLKITKISKNTSKFLFSNENWSFLKNLLNGNVMLIQSTNNDNKSINLEILKKLMENKKFSIRFFISNNQIYRKQDLQNSLKDISLEKNASKLSLFFLETLKNNNVLIQTLYKRTNNIKE